MAHLEKAIIGRASADLPEDSNILQVDVTSLLPAAAQGAFGPGITDVTVQTVNEHGVAESSAARTANHIVAEWIGDRLSTIPPSIRAGEQVKLHRVGNTDKWYWEPMGRDRDLRQTDQVCLEVSASSKKKSDKSDSNTYKVDVNTKKKYLQIKTSKDLGEPFAYSIKIDTANGVLSITDDNGDNGNRIVIVSGQKTIHINNTDGASAILKEKYIIYYAPRDLLMKAERQILMDAPSITLNKDKAGVIVLNAGSIAFNAGADVIVSAARFGVSATSKFVGAVAAGAMRAISYATGDVGSAYAASTTDINAGSNTPADNASDTDTSGGGDRRASAYEQVTKAFSAVVTELSKVAAKVGVSVDGGSITSPANQSNIDKLKGE